MRYRIEFIRVVPGQEDEVLETITLEVATVRAAEARAHALFENATASETADGFRIIEFSSPRSSPVDARICSSGLTAAPSSVDKSRLTRIFQALRALALRIGLLP